MHKFFSKILILSLLFSSLLISGCTRKDTDIVLSEPVKTTEEAADNSENVADKAGSELAAESSSENSDKAADSTSEKESEPESIMVHVCGAVNCQGVFELPAGSRVVDAVKAAGGFSDDADTAYVNQAQVLEDGVKLKIPTAEETAELLADDGDEKSSEAENPGGITGSSADTGALASSKGDNAEGGKVNINTATEAQLCSIPGIGPSRAQNILSYREENGKFGTIKDIMNVTGIKDKFFTKIKDYITV